LTSAPVLATLDLQTDFILKTDVSDMAIGGVLAQRQLFEGKVVERPLEYFSRKLHTVETRYPIYDRELLAISANLEHWACYVDGRKRTTIYTDHAALQHILGQNKLTSHQWRRLDKLQQYNYEVKYFPGAANVVADALSWIVYTRQAEPEATLRESEAMLSSAPESINAVELRISASVEWLDDVQAGYSQDDIFGSVLEHLTDAAVRHVEDSVKYDRKRTIRLLV
jgi:hypothetical protein